MKRNRLIFESATVSVLGTLLHFAYEWSNKNPLFAVFGAINESVWEHLKLLFWPCFIITVAELLILKRQKEGFLLSRFAGAFCGMVTIVAVFYTLSGVLGSEIGWFNIILFYISVLLSFALSDLFMKNKCFNFKHSVAWGFSLFLALSLLFAVFSFNPPNAGIFKEPSVTALF